MSSFRVSATSLVALATASLCAASGAAAQSAPAAPSQQQQQQQQQQQRQQPAPPAERGQTVTVTGSRPQVIDAPDRLSFNVANDLGAQTGSLADALRNVPGVEVDLEGRVSLRGDPGVTILVDGRPSAQLRGEGRGDALQAMPASNIERVEVITNPSADLSPEGSGGVINLVTKKRRPGGTTGAVRANAGLEGRGSVALSLARSRPGSTITGEAALRRFTNEVDVTQERVRFGTNGGADLSSRRTSLLDNAATFSNVRVGIEQEIDKRNRVTADIGLQDGRNRSLRDETFLGNVAEPGFVQDSRFYFRQRNFELRTSFQHSFPDKGHSFVAEGAIERGRVRRGSDNERVVVGQPALSEDIRNKGAVREERAKLEYKRPLGAERSLTLGYQVDRSALDFDFSAFRGPSGGVLLPVPGLTNAFDFGQSVQALYATMQLNEGKWEIQPGLRAEQVELDLLQRTDGTDFDRSYFRLYPTLHVGRALSDTVKLRGSYSRRIQRPGPLDLNPFLLFQDSRNFTRGNPDLKPEVTDAFELALQYRKGATFLSLTGFLRRSRDMFTEVIETLPDGSLLTTRANLGSGRRIGADAILNGRLSKAVTYNLSGTLQHMELDPDGLGGTIAEVSGVVGSLRGSVNVQPSPKDFIQLSGNWQGKQLLPQGYRLGGPVLNLGYRRKVNEQLSLLLTGNNILNTARQEVVIRTPTFRDRLLFEPRGRVFLVGLAYNFGQGNGRRKAEPGFEFEPGGGVPQ